MNKATEIKSEIKQMIISVIPDAEVILFGSRARNTHQTESDWDVLVLTSIYETIPYTLEKKLAEKMLDVELKYGTSISTFTYNKEYWKKRGSASSLYVSVAKEGVLL